MFLRRGSRALRRQWRTCRGMTRTAADVQMRGGLYYAVAARDFHSTRRAPAVKPVLLADIGEGIVECEIIQWFVEPEARVEEFSPLCEVQSDKASVEITSRFAGVVKKLYYEAGEMAKVGKPFVDIDIAGDAKQQDLDALTAPEPARDGPSEPLNKEALSRPHGSQGSEQQQSPATRPQSEEAVRQPPPQEKSRFASLATPAVRHLCKELDVVVTDVTGTGKAGRVSKEDIYKFVEARNAGEQAASAAKATPATPPPAPSAADKQTETIVPLTNNQQHMFKTMTRSLNIPHFLYTDEVDFSQLYELRLRLNKALLQSSTEGEVTKMTYLPFIIKAVSLALYRYPLLNARVDVDPVTSRPALVHRSQHNIGVAMDTPQGLFVPVIRNVGAKNLLSIASELEGLRCRAAAGRLSVQDLAGGTITVSNIGGIGGTYLSPVIVEREVAILGVGRMRTVPAFGEGDRVVRKQVCNFSWSADHRVVDGATMARAAEVVRQIVEEPDSMILQLR